MNYDKIIEINFTEEEYNKIMDVYEMFHKLTGDIYSEYEYPTKVVISNSKQKMTMDDIQNVYECLDEFTGEAERSEEDD